jgi:hypothetical protein
MRVGRFGHHVVAAMVGCASTSGCGAQASDPPSSEDGGFGEGTDGRPAGPNGLTENAGPAGIAGGDAGAGTAVGNSDRGSADGMGRSVDAEDASPAHSGGPVDSMDGASDGSRDGSMDRPDGAPGGSTSATSDATEVCTSGVYWQGQTGPTMDPGDTCPSCHSSFQIAGTIYPTADEPTDCNGVTGSNLSVVITDANGNVQTLAVNASGNFYSTKAVVFPFHAKVLSKTAERDMVAAQSTGDCNYCHTPMGLNGAPGRIMSP